MKYQVSTYWHSWNRFVIIPTISVKHERSERFGNYFEIEFEFAFVFCGIAFNEKINQQ